MNADELKPLLGDSFLDTLSECAKNYGWLGDHVCTEDFVNYCFDVAGKAHVDLTPNDLD
jgi:hypothetical protein